MTMMGNDEDHQYVLAIMLPFNMPWSEEEPGVSFWNWFGRVFSRVDNTTLWKFMGDATDLLQQEEYVTAFPTKANSHPLMKHQKGFDAEPPDTFPYHPSACVKLILRNVRSLSDDMPPVIRASYGRLDASSPVSVAMVMVDELIARRSALKQYIALVEQAATV